MDIPKYILLLLLAYNASFCQSVEHKGEHSLVNTYYQTFGNGQRTMLIINGGPGANSEGFASLAQDLADRYNLTTIIYDQRGTGKTSMSNVAQEYFTLDYMVEDIEHLRLELGVNSWLVFGQSFGGMLGAYYAAKHSDVVDGLILSSTGGIDLNSVSGIRTLSKLSESDLEQYYYWDRHYRSNPSAEHEYKRALFLAKAYVVDEKFAPQIAQRLTQVDMSVNRKVFNNMYRMNFDCKGELSTFKKPTLILHGVDDIVPLEAAETAHRVIPNSTLHIIPNSAHYGWLDNPDSYFGAIDTFMDI